MLVRALFAISLTAVAVLMTGCSSRTAIDGSDPTVVLPKECDEYIATMNRCTTSTAPAELAAARSEQARASLLAQAQREPNAIAELRAKCTSARVALSTACR